MSMLQSPPVLLQRSFWGPKFYTAAYENYCNKKDQKRKLKVSGFVFQKLFEQI